MQEKSINKEPLRALDTQMVITLLRQIPGCCEDELLQWEVQAIPNATGPATDGVYRLTGTRQHHGQETGWSIILKVLRRTPAGKAPAGSEQEHVLYWKREALAYQSGLLDDLPGTIRGPHCYAIIEQDDESIWLWLEDVKDRYGPCWPLSQYAQAARSLGQMNGAYLAGRPLPSYSWLVRTGSPRGILDHYSWKWKAAQDPMTWQHPLLRSAFPIPIADRLWRLWEDLGLLLDILERLPQTFCHLDAWRGNLFAAPKTDEKYSLTAIDWSYPGLGTIATDIGDLMAPSFGLFKVEPCHPRTLDRVIFESYLEGLSASGWQGNHKVVRCAFALFTALKYSGVLFWLYQIIDESQHASWEQRAGHPLSECLQNQAILIYYLLDLADEGRRLIDSV